MASTSVRSNPLTMCIRSLLFLSLWTGSNSLCSETKRVRQPWHSLSEEEQLLYVEGFKTLRRSGTLVIFLESHDNANVNYHVHETGQNFFWHSYWLYELENSFRRIGPKFECFTLPYWDITNDEAAWSAMDVNTRSVSDLPMYNSNLGGEGNVNDHYCVEDALWSVAEYTTEYICADTEVSPNCCLKRFHTDSDDSILPTRTEIAEAVFTDKAYATFENFSIAVNDYHSNVHTFVGSVEGETHFNPVNGEPEVDPLFPLFHAFIDYIRLMREDCYDFDLLRPTELDGAIPYAYGTNENMTLDYIMEFSILCDDSGDQGWRMCSDVDITPRLMFDMSPNSPFNIVYELGDFWTDNDKLREECAYSLNSSWWRIAEDDPMETETKKSFMNSAWQSLPSNTTSVSAIMVMVIAIAVMALLRSCELRMRKKKVAELMDGDEAAYGAI